VETLSFLIARSFNDTSATAQFDLLPSMMTVNVKLKGVWNEAIVAYIEVRFQRLSGGTDEIHENARCW
jgi:hypothetical protein